MLWGYLEDYLCVPTAVAAIAIFALLRSLDNGKGTFHSTLARLSGMTFGVYLCHLMIAAGLTHFGHLDASASVLALVAAWAATLILSFAFVLVAIRIPTARRVVGGQC